MHQSIPGQAKRLNRLQRLRRAPQTVCPARPRAGQLQRPAQGGGHVQDHQGAHHALSERDGLLQALRGRGADPRDADGQAGAGHFTSGERSHLRFRRADGYL